MAPRWMMQAWVLAALGLPVTAPQHTLPRQPIDANTLPQRAATVTSTAAVTATAAAQPPRAAPVAFDVDVEAIPLAFGVNQLQQLADQGHTTLHLPGLAPVQLRLQSVRELHGMHTLTFTHAGLVGTATRRGQRFFISLHTPAGGYRIEGRANQATALANTGIAARTISMSGDFRVAH